MPNIGMMPNMVTMEPNTCTESVTTITHFTQGATYQLQLAKM